MIKKMNANSFLFQKIKYNFTKEYNDLLYKEKYIKIKENLLEYVCYNYFKNNNEYLQDVIIKNPNINLKLILNLFDKFNKWYINKNLKFLSYHKIDIYTLIHFDHYNFEWDSKGISCNKYISIEDIFRYPFISWDYKCLLKNPNLTMEIFENIYKLYEGDTIDYLDELSFNPNITIDIIEKYKDIKWNWIGISDNIKNLSMANYIKYIEYWDHNLLSKNIDFKIFDKFPDKNWNFVYLSENENLDIEIIRKHLIKKWAWYFISKHDNITIDIIKKYIYLPWYWEQISSNKNINIEFVKENLNKNWDIHNLSANPNITMYDIKHNNFNWDMNGILLNPNIDKENIEKYKNHKNFPNIYWNTFLYDDTVFNRRINVDRNKQKNKIKNILNKYITRDFIEIINLYTDYY